eukprot:CCRYP_007491-RG/>CCRYP_007491-RG protein AED:0.50 eAED:0.50 QI:0/-1/0/1/-1/0/1/0/9
MPAISLQKS